MIDYSLLIIGFFFTFFVPGFLIVETFFDTLPKIQRLPLYLLLSVLVSTYLVYFVSLIIGYSRYSILLSFLLFLPWLIVTGKKINKKINLNLILSQKHAGGIILSLAVFIVFFIALYPAIFSKNQNYYIMSAVNWQDTAMHQEIIQSISQGNFPPQAPYYSGVPLSYYYFADFHTAILQTLTDKFSPRILVFDNPFFVFIFSLSLYVLAYYFTKSRLAALLATLLGVFSSNFMFIKFFHDISNIDLAKGFLSQVLNLMANHGYTMEYQKLMQMVPMTDYFLQNRPMMVGLPGIVLAILLIYSGFNEKDNKKLLLAGIIGGMLVKFQFFAWGLSLVIFLLAFVMFFERKSYRTQLIRLLLFTVPFFIFSSFIFSTFVNQHSLITIVREGFSLGPWDKTRDVVWYLQFSFLNFGIPFVIALFGFLNFISKKQQRDKTYAFLFLLFLMLFAVPHMVRFTIYDGDMFKFFYFMMIPICIITGSFLSKIWKFKLGAVLVIIILILSSLTSVLTLSWSFLNKNSAYSQEDYQAGLWIRNNTPANSVFASLPTIHTPISQIGGKSRILSYINWPYSHGYNTGEDNVFSRLEDLENLYRNSNDNSNILNTMNKYKATYVFYGPEERSRFPQAELDLDNSRYLRLVYDFDSIKIYEFKKIS